MTGHCRDLEIFLTVAICTHRRADRLESALASLERQSHPGADIEVLIVENDCDSTPAVKAVFKRHKGTLNLRYVHESSIGLSHARNTALRLAKGSYLAYLDDDAEADGDWLAALVRECRINQPDFCGGPVYPLYRSAKPEWFLDRYATMYLYGELPRWLAKGEWFGGGNLAMDRRLCLQLGGFRTDLGMTGKTVAYGEETEMLMRAWNRNPSLRVWYAPQVSIRHEVRAEKMSLRWRIRAAWAGGRDSVVIFPLKRWQALGDLLRIMVDLRLFSVRVLFGLQGEERKLWQQWAYEVLYPWVWQFSRGWFALFTGKR